MPSFSCFASVLALLWKLLFQRNIWFDMQSEKMILGAGGRRQSTSPLDARIFGKQSEILVRSVSPNAFSLTQDWHFRREKTGAATFVDASNLWGVPNLTRITCNPQWNSSSELLETKDSNTRLVVAVFHTDHKTLFSDSYNCNNQNRSPDRGSTFFPLPRCFCRDW